MGTATKASDTEFRIIEMKITSTTTPCFPCPKKQGYEDYNNANSNGFCNKKCTNCTALLNKEELTDKFKDCCDAGNIQFFQYLQSALKPIKKILEAMPSYQQYLANLILAPCFLFKPSKDPNEKEKFKYLFSWNCANCKVLIPGFREDETDDETYTKSSVLLQKDDNAIAKYIENELKYISQNTESKLGNVQEFRENLFKLAKLLRSNHPLYRLLNIAKQIFDLILLEINSKLSMNAIFIELPYNGRSFLIADMKNQLSIDALDAVGAKLDMLNRDDLPELLYISSAEVKPSTINKYEIKHFKFPLSFSGYHLENKEYNYKAFPYYKSVEVLPYLFPLLFLNGPEFFKADPMKVTNGSLLLSFMYERLETSIFNINNKKKTKNNDNQTLVQFFYCFAYGYHTSNTLEFMKNNNDISSIPSDNLDGPNYLREKAKDAEAMIVEFGDPDFLLTMAANPDDVVDSMFGIVTVRNFRLKVREILKKLRTKKNILGKHVAHAGKFEFQDMGNIHCHIVLWVEKPLYENVKAEIPPKPTGRKCNFTDQQHEDLKYYDLVTKYQIHTCGKSCAQGSGECRHGYPKPFSDKVQQPKDGKAAMLLRRKPNGKKFCLKKPRGNGTYTSQDVVAHSKELILFSNGMVSVEPLVGKEAVLYAMKYAWNPPSVGHEKNDIISLHLSNMVIDTHWACLRLLQKSYVFMFPTVHRMIVHLPDDQYHQQGDGHKSELMKFFEHNEKINKLLKSDGSPKSCDIVQNYLDNPNYVTFLENYRFDKSGNVVKRLKARRFIIRHPKFNDFERKMLYQMLVTTPKSKKLPTSFASLKKTTKKNRSKQAPKKIQKRVLRSRR
ncbi:unnamed protein product [Ambrosiozyma monospora]|uniref:Unnamed protein product n=1 Tax=Ambrosiozyma monospora TaxID=43982 RepID=A0ACB5SWK4_AMBMO|nr:unnamed protein product [Ambrosiozyma monospora]